MKIFTLALLAFTTQAMTVQQVTPATDPVRVAAKDFVHEIFEDVDGIMDGAKDGKINQSETEKGFDWAVDAGVVTQDM